MSQGASRPLHSKKNQNSRTTHKPFSVSWVIPGRLAVGGLPRPEDYADLVTHNIGVILCLADELEAPPPLNANDQFYYLRFPLPDSRHAAELGVDQLARAVSIVQQSIQKNLTVYVHCLAGIERSPTVCIAYLCRYHKLELWEAISWLKQVRPPSQPTEFQVRVIRNYLNQCQLGHLRDFA